jgi:cytochrome c-type biogenesis protein
MDLQQQLLSGLNNHSATVVGLSFLGGIVSSLLPCSVSMLPVLIGYVGGYSEDSRLGVFQQVALFITGVALVMTILGLSASLLGVAFGGLVGSNWYYLVGVLAVVMGLHLLNVIQIPLPQFVTKLPDSKPGHIIAPLLLGMAFGAASSPCGTPFLTAILGFISQEKNIALGGVSLFAYALGQCLLLLVVGLFTGLLKHMAIVRHAGRIIHTLSGAVFVLAGLIIIAQGAGWLDILAFIPAE